MALPEADAAINSNTNELGTSQQQVYRVRICSLFRARHEVNGNCRNLMREHIGNRDPAPIHFSWPFANLSVAMQSESAALWREMCARVSGGGVRDEHMQIRSL